VGSVSRGEAKRRERKVSGIRRSSRQKAARRYGEESRGRDLPNAESKGLLLVEGHLERGLGVLSRPLDWVPPLRWPPRKQSKLATLREEALWERDDIPPA